MKAGVAASKVKAGVRGGRGIGGVRGVRVMGGAFRGRALVVPAGARPTEGRVREALFSIWREAVDGARFLDLFAGSGVVGLEAGGRGALAVLCVDEEAAAVRAIAANAARVGGGRHAAAEESVPPTPVAVLRLPLPAGLPRLAEQAPFDLVFADPPYAFAAYDRLLAGLPPLLAPGAEVAVEHAARRDLPLGAGVLVRVDVRRYGESALSFYRQEGAMDPLAPSKP